MELIVCVAIIGILISLSVPNLRAAGETAQRVGCESNQRLLRLELDQWELVQHQPLPEKSDDIVQALVNANLLETAPRCPSGGHYDILREPDGTMRVSCSVHGTLGE
ncbi:MAG: hypothetical protein IRY98_12475 [Alicyclobacillaceae bacterium]|nr:hypothetical protein [Alicyclobacillaceae bacterium]